MGPRVRSEFLLRRYSYQALCFSSPILRPRLVISASNPQIAAAVEELRSRGYNLPDYPEDPKTEDSKAEIPKFETALHLESNSDSQDFPSESLKGKSLKGRNVYCGFYLNELIMRLTWKDEPQKDLFLIYQQTLQGLLLLDNDQQSEPFLRRFEFHLLTILGYQYNWQQDSDCRDIQADQYYNFDPAAGFRALNSEHYGNRPSASGLSFPGEAILAIAANDWQHTMSWKVAKKIARLALQPLLGHKPLTSRALFQTL